MSQCLGTVEQSFSSCTVVAAPRRAGRRSAALADARISREFILIKALTLVEFVFDYMLLLTLPRTGCLKFPELAVAASVEYSLSSHLTRLTCSVTERCCFVSSYRPRRRRRRRRHRRRPQECRRRDGPDAL